MKKRKFTIEELKKMKRFLIILIIIITLLLCTGAIILLYFCNSTIYNDPTVFFQLILVILIPVVAIQILVEKCEKEIKYKEEQIKLKTLNYLATESNLKEYVVIKRSDIIKSVLIAGIEKVEIQKNNNKQSEEITKDKEFILNIYLKNGKSIDSVLFSNSKVLELLDTKLEEKIFEQLVTQINLCKEEYCIECEDETELIMSGKSFYYETTIKDNEILDIFDLKDDEK